MLGGDPLPIVLGSVAVAVWTPILLWHLSGGDNPRQRLAIAMLYVVGVSAIASGYFDPPVRSAVTFELLKPDGLAVVVSRGGSAAILLLLLGLALSYTRTPAFQTKLGWPGRLLLLVVVDAALIGFVRGVTDPRLLLLPAVYLVVLADRTAPQVIAIHVRNILRVAIVASLVMCFRDVPGAFFELSERSFNGYSQLAGVAGHPNVLAPVAVAALVLELSQRRGTKVARVTFAGAAVAAVLLAQSRAGLVVGILCGVLFLIRRRRAVTVALMTVITASVAAFFSPPTILSDLQAELNGRDSIYTFALEVWRQHPLLGSGPRALGQQSQGTDLQALAAQAHNQVVNSLAVGGVVAATLVALLLLVWLRQGLRLWNSTWWPMALTVIVFSTSLVESPLSSAPLSLTTLLVALAARALCTRVSDYSAADPTPPDSLSQATSAADQQSLSRQGLAG